MKIINDTIFKSITVTAHEWMPMKEVKESELAKYLLAMKCEGWSIVGIEQSNTSVCLSQFVFPVKSIMLLGREKEGIPSDLMHLLDHVVEIPQLGVIRYT